MTNSTARLLGTTVMFIAIAAPGSGEEATRDLKDCHLIINWDDASMFAIQLGHAQRDNGVPREKWAWITETPGYVRRDPKPDATGTFEPDAIKALMEQIVDEHAKAKVDCIVHCLYVMPNGAVPPDLKSVHRSSAWRRAGYSDFTSFEQAGHDLVRTLLARSRKNGMLFLAGLRMNDRHGGSAEAPFFLENPDWRLKDLNHGMDYKYEGVRNNVLAFTEEFLAKYDVDGIELDWMRWCHMFQRSEAEANAPLLTDLVTKLRGIVDEAGRKRGRKLIVGMRIPQTLEECKSLGFDVKVWVQQGAVDYICPSDFFNTDFNIRTEDFVALTQGTQCRVYPSVHPNISRENQRNTHTLESYRAAAKNYYAFGASGISAYNYQYHWRSDMGSEDEWPRALGYLTALRNAQAVARGDRHYMYYPLWQGVSESGAYKHDVIELARDKAHWSDPLRLRMAEDLASPRLSATLEFKVVGMTEEDALEVRLNGQVIQIDRLSRLLDADGQSAEEGRPKPAFWLYRVPVGSPPMKSGDNELCLRLTKSAGTAKLVAQEFEIRVRNSLIDEKPDSTSVDAVASPIRARVGLFDHSRPDTLGLTALPGEHTLLYQATKDGYKYSHHPNLGVFQGQLFAMWSSGIEREDDNGQRVLCCQSRDGVHWTEPVVLIEDPDGDGPLACVAAGFHATDDVLTAYYTTITRKHETHERDRLLAVTSRDGRTWNKPRTLGQGFFIESPRRLRAGRLLMNGQYDMSRPHLMFTDAADGLSGWQDAELPASEGFSWPEPSWFQKADGSVVMLFRRQTTNAQATLYASASYDNGKTWSRPAATNFSDATARFAAGNLPDGTPYIINNPSHAPDKNFTFIGRRNPLVISLSHDGVTFERAFVIRGEATTMRFPGRNLKADGWQYPAALVWHDHLYVIYSVNKEDVGVTRIRLDSLDRVRVVK